MRTFGKRLRGRYSISYFLLIFLVYFHILNLLPFDLINLLFLYQCLSWRIEFFIKETQFLRNSVQWHVILVLQSSWKKVITFISERAIH